VKAAANRRIRRHEEIAGDSVVLGLFEARGADAVGRELEDGGARGHHPADARASDVDVRIMTAQTLSKIQPPR
jgi:hypothetical protein